MISFLKHVEKQIKKMENCIANDLSMFNKLKNKELKEDVIELWLQTRIEECEKILNELNNNDNS